jgi:type IX secretion system PorP/SprF family membrane protein
MKNHSLKLILGLVLFCLQSLKAQQDPQFTQFYNNRLYFNPAFAGTEQETQYSFAYRNQWTGYQPSFDVGGAPNTAVFSFNTAVPAFKSGIGGYIMRDQLGPLTNYEVQLSYAYHVSIGRNSILSFGVRGGMYIRSVNGGIYRFRDGGDPLIIGESDSNFRPDFGAGVYYKSPRAFVGLMSNHLNQASFNFGVKTEGLVNNTTLMGGYEVVNTDRFIIMPNFLVKTARFSTLSFDAGALLTYKANNDRQFWFGFSYRDEESANAIVGVTLPSKNKKNLTRNLKIGYSFDYVFQGQTAKQPVSHEITLVYSLPVKPVVPLPTIRTPRYRYN